MFYVYILHSSSRNIFYAGQTDNLEKRFNDHNRRASPYTKRGSPWTLVVSFQVSSRTDAIKLESKIKSRGIKRFLQDMNIPFSESKPGYH
jgi:putative endonuclease